MINVSDEYKQKIKNNRNMYADIRIITASGTEISIQQKHIRQLVLNDDVSGSTSFDIGSAIINQCTMKLDNSERDYDGIEFDQAEITVKIGLQLSSTVEWIQKGVYTADPGEEAGDVITIKAFDHMRRFDRAYSDSNLSYPATLGQIVRDACEMCDVPAEFSSFEHDDFVVSARPDSETVTFREVLTWAGQISCHWFRCNPKGELSAGFYNTVSYETGIEEDFHEISIISALSRSTEDIVITGIKVDQEDATYMSGSDGYVLSVEDNELIQGQDGLTVAQMLGEKLIGLSFRKLSVTHQSDPSIEAGDLAKVTDRKGNVYKTLITSVSFQFGGSQKSSCNAETPAHNSTQRFSQSTKNYVALRKQINAEKSERETAVEQLQKTLKESSGLYQSSVLQEDGSTIYYLHDKPSISESKTVIKLTAEAIGVSTDGGNTYPYGFTVTGEMITRVLQTEGINADWINTGEFAVKDQNGNTIFSANIDTGTVSINGDSVMIGDKTATQAIKDANDTAEKAKNMALHLSNDFQAIPVDATGEYTEFPECLTVVSVFYGFLDISSDCTYAVTTSNAITGTWDKTSRTYKVTSLSADTGWVDIKATYAVELSVSKRFTVTKLYAGETGKDGNTFYFENSEDIVRIEKDGWTKPYHIDFAVYYRSGDNSEKVSYHGYYKIEETKDGIIWDTLYISDAAESELTWFLCDILSDYDDCTVVDNDGSFVASGMRDIYGIRCTFYTDINMTSILGIKNISVIKDVDALTQEEIVNILTDDGAWKGLYYKNGRLYISFNYALGGNLDLGGVNNGNGRLRIIDSSGEIIGYIDNTGVNFNKGNFTGTISGGLIIGSDITTSTKNAKSAIKMNEGILEFSDYNADSGYYSAGNIHPDVRVIYLYNPDNDLLIETNVSSIAVDANNCFEVKVNGITAFYCFPDTTFGEDTTKVKVYTRLLDAETLYADTLEVSGTKSRIVNGTYFGDRLLYSYETPTPQFGDIGFGKLNEDGECYISIDDIFSETINTHMEYAVFLQKEGQGDIWVDSKETTYFIVKGTPGLPFSWELKAVQKGFEQLRLDDRALKDMETEDISDLETIFDDELKEYDNETEVMFDESTESIPGD